MRRRYPNGAWRPPLSLVEARRRGYWTQSLDQAPPHQPFLNDLGDLRVVLVLHHHVRIALDADVGQVDHVDGSTTRAHGGGIFEIDLLERRPARMLVDVV